MNPKGGAFCRKITDFLIRQGHFLKKNSILDLPRQPETMRSLGLDTNCVQLGKSKYGLEVLLGAFTEI